MTFFPSLLRSARVLCAYLFEFLRVESLYSSEVSYAGLYEQKSIMDEGSYASSNISWWQDGIVSRITPTSANLILEQMLPLNIDKILSNLVAIKLRSLIMLTKNVQVYRISVNKNYC